MSEKENKINNACYDTLGDAWYESASHPIALLRAEAGRKLDYVREIFARNAVARDARVLDVGCGAGLIANPLGESGYRVTGLDASEGSLQTARARDASGGIRYVVGDAKRLPFDDGSFSAVLLLDVLEHIDDPGKVLAEGARVLAPGGVVVVHTFNRTWESRLAAVEALKWLRDYPRDADGAHIHVHDWFITPEEMAGHAEQAGLRVGGWRGIAPRVFSRAFWSTALRRRVSPGFEFVYSRSLRLGYLGFLTKPSGSPS